MIENSCGGGRAKFSQGTRGLEDSCSSCYVCGRNSDRGSSEQTILGSKSSTTDEMQDDSGKLTYETRFSAVQ